jgi:YD repeat-containing protein
MSVIFDPFKTANYRARKVAYDKWHRLQSKTHILRSQLGFQESAETRPAVCQGCHHYHGIAYGQTRDRRTLLICAFHPYGWHQPGGCPDWQPEECQEPS